jgi:hypothetical protein
VGHFDQILMLLGAAAVGVVLVLAVRWRRRGYHATAMELAEGAVCAHLRSAYDLLVSRGHVVVQVGQKAEDYPVEIHMAPPFDPRGLYDELKLAEPVFVSERNVLYCKDDWCELHPKKS